MIFRQHSRRWLRIISWSLGLLAGNLLAAAFYLGNGYVAPKNKPVSPPPSSWLVENVRFNENKLAGWYVPSQPHQKSPCILLLHGFKSSRTGLIPIADFLRKAGFSLFLFDFRGHGESQPDTITFGLKESDDARAALNWLHDHGRCTHIGVWGHSMGGASALLGQSPLPAEAFVLDSTYATLEQATKHRILNTIGHPMADILSPLLIAQIPWRLHTTYAQLHPVEAIAHLHAPTLIIYGTEDRAAYPEEAQALFQAVGTKDKELWAVQGASHDATHSIDPDNYAKKVVTFFRKYLI